MPSKAIENPVSEISSADLAEAVDRLVGELRPHAIYRFGSHAQVLVLNGQRPPRTHSLADLSGLGGRWLPEVKHEAECSWLTTFAVETRDPHRGQPVTADMAKQVLNNAQTLFDFVRSSVSTEVRP